MKAQKLKVGWGTWIRTKIDGVRVLCSTVELSPNGRPKARFARGRGASIAKRGGRRKRSALAAGPFDRRQVASRAKAWRLAACLDLLHRHHSGRGLERAGDRRAHGIA